MSRQPDISDPNRCSFSCPGSANGGGVSHEIEVGESSLSGGADRLRCRVHKGSHGEKPSERSTRYGLSSSCRLRNRERKGCPPRRPHSGLLLRRIPAARPSREIARAEILPALA